MTEIRKWGRQEEHGHVEPPPGAVLGRLLHHILNPPPVDGPPFVHRHTTPPVCASCSDSGYVCENHPDRPWGGMVGEPCCGGAGMPCPVCCDPIPMDGTTSITDAFTPRHLRRPPGESSG